MTLRKQHLPATWPHRGWDTHRFVTGFFSIGYFFSVTFFFSGHLRYGTGRAKHNTEHVHCVSNSIICRVLLAGISSTFKTHLFFQKTVGYDWLLPSKDLPNLSSAEYVDTSI